MFEIICLGRLDFLQAVLNGLAMITSDAGPAGYGGMVALGLLVGVLLALARSVVTQRLELQWILAGWLLFTTLFVPKVTVTVEELSTGATVDVANVPLGPAAIGSITSTLGLRIAEAFETVFAYPSMTDAGYLDSLDLIQAMRDMDEGDANDGDAGATVAGVNVSKTLDEYMVKCVMEAISLKVPGMAPSETELREAADLTAAMQVNNNVLSTTVYLTAGTPEGVTMGCTDAYAAITAYLQDPFYPAWRQSIGDKLRLDDTEAQMQGALDAILGAGESAQRFMLNSLLKKHLELASVGWAAEGGDAATTLLRVQSMEQRRIQWAAEQSMWSEMARPAISFIEGFFYAVSPIMGFMFCLGAPGLAVFARYLMFAVWIQLWMPVLAISNMFIQVCASNDLARIKAHGIPMASMVGLDSVWTETASYIALGANMVAATPLLTFIIISGSYFAFTGLTNRLSGGDHINEKTMAPDVLQPAAVASTGALMAQSAHAVTDVAMGTRAYNAEGAMGNVGVSESISHNVQSSERAMHDSAVRLLQDRGASIDFSRSSDVSRFTNNMLSNSTSSSNSETDAIVRSVAQSIVGGKERFAQLDTKDQTAVSAAVSAALGAKFAGTGLGTNVNGQLSAIETRVDGEGTKWADNLRQELASNKSLSANFARAIISDEQKGSRGSFVRSMGVTDSAKDSESMSAAVQSAKAFDEWTGEQTSVSNSFSMSKLQAARLLMQDGGGGELYHLASTSGTKDGKGAMEEVQRLQHNFMMDPLKQLDAKSALAVGLMDTLLGDQVSSETNQKAIDIITRHLAPEVDAGGDPLAQSHLKDAAPNVQVQSDHLRREVDSGLQPLPAAGAVRGLVDRELGADPLGGKARADAAVQNFFDAALTGNRTEMEAAQKEIESISLEREAAFLKPELERDRSTMQSVLEHLTARGFDPGLESIARNQQAAWEAGKDAYNTTYDRMRHEGHNPLVSGLAASFAAANAKFDDADVQYMKEGIKTAQDHGMPSAAAQYYAAAYTLSHGTQFRNVMSPQLGYVMGSMEEKQLAPLRAASEKEVGHAATVALERAATTNEERAEVYFGQAETLVRAQQADKVSFH